MRILDLSGDWWVCAAGSEDWFPARVPGCIHTDLLAAGRIDDPYIKDNELRAYWVGETDWIYRRTYSVSPEFLGAERVLLRAHGLDTLATIEINGRILAFPNNQFRNWEFDAAGLLQAGENEICIRFDSATAYGRARLAERYIHAWINNEDKFPGGNYLRKSQCNFGWDWGPKLVTCGIQGGIELLAFDTARLRDVHVRQNHADGRVRLSVAVSAECAGEPQNLGAVLRLELRGALVAEVHLDMSAGSTEAGLEVAAPELWWPNGLGDQPLYRLVVTLHSGGAEIDRREQWIGLRTLRLERKPDAWGESFHFSCNGVPFFAKGANWIPADTFVSRVSAADYERLLSDAAAVHMNMLRVWGGGIYEPDVFYDLCDRLGIVVWQDFMFACATYPTYDPAFLTNVEAEAREQVRRLRGHASLGLWCGNNELEQGLVDDEWTATAMSWEDYSCLFDDLLARLTAELDPDTDYWPGSPHTPVGDRRNFNDPRSGDAHVWDVWHGLEPFEYYRRFEQRFNSEFGFQSFPEPATVAAFAGPEDFSLNSPIMDHHQRSPSGNAKIVHYLLDWFRLPNGFADQLLISQVLQGMAIKYAVEHWRRSMPRGMGTLYWQLNDCWPVASWSSIDHPGRWKALHYMARGFFSPRLISGVDDWEAGTLEVHVTNDQPDDLPGVVTWQVFSAADGSLILAGAEESSFRKLGDTTLPRLDFSALLEELGRRNVIFRLALEADGRIVSTNMVLFCRPKQLSLVHPQIDVQVEPAGPERLRIRLETDRPALWVRLELPGELRPLPDNFFHLFPGFGQAFEIETGETAESFRQRLRVSSLRDTYP